MLVIIQDPKILDKYLAENKHNDILMILIFSATYCGPCKQIMPLVTAFSDERPEIIMFSIDIDECSSIVELFQITATPTFIFVKHGNRLGQMMGANFEKFKDLVDKAVAMTKKTKDGND